MNEKNENALVPRLPSVVEKAGSGPKRILSGMVADTLAVANREQRMASTKFRIGDYEWCEPDYRQILIWAEETGLKPEEVLVRLFDQEAAREWDERHRFGSRTLLEPLFEDGRLLKVNLDLQMLRSSRLEWVNGLEITHLRFTGASDAAGLSNLV